MKRILFAALSVALIYTQGCKVKGEPSAEMLKKHAEDSIQAKAAIDSLKGIIRDIKEGQKSAKALPTARELYRATNTRKHDIIHTKLEVKFNYETSTMPGKATLLIKPYFYATDSLVLDAKAMDINEVSLINGKEKKKLAFTYDSLKIHIKLDRTYTRNEQYTIFIDYTSNPERVSQTGSAAITDAKGLYFIDPKNTDPNKPTQIWTQGETEAASCWFPTIDSPNEKCTEEIYMTVDKKYVTLSNGKLVSQKDNGDGTRTDYWKQDLAHSPYLFMMAVGEFAVIKDKWRNKMEVNYYVEKDYEPYAKQIFGNTPEMLEFFSTKLGVDYAWDKYSQIVVRDYVSGAMENTSATVHGEFLQRNARELMDETNESIIAHELFHHWFGDLATCESWSNLPLNESFANYSEYLWMEYKYGRDEADQHWAEDLDGYLNEAGEGKRVDLIRFDYKNKEDMFDRHSYNKGGCVLHMLRKYVGDDAFFLALKDYLSTNKFQNTEIHNLRLSFEKVTGEDRNWFFNQWFLDKSHPELNVDFGYTPGKAIVTVEQQQDLTLSPIYKIPVDIDVYIDGKATRHRVVIDSLTNKFYLPVSKKPELIIFDAEHQLVGVIKDTHSREDLVLQYTLAPLHFDRADAVERLAKKSKSAEAVKVLKLALDDKFYGIREAALKSIPKIPNENFAGLKDKIMGIAKNDPKSKVRAAAISALAKMFEGDNTLAQFYQECLTNDKSYLVIGAALNALGGVDKPVALKEAKKLENEKSGDVLLGVATLYAESGEAGYYDFFANGYKNVSGANEKYTFVTLFGNYMAKQKDEALLNKGIDFAVNIIETENAWWMKLAGYTMLNAIGGKYRDDIRDLQKSGADKDLLKVAQTQFDKVSGLFTSHLKAEKDPNVLKYLGGGE